MANYFNKGDQVSLIGSSNTTTVIGTNPDYPGEIITCFNGQYCSVPRTHLQHACQNKDYIWDSDLSDY